MRLLFLATALCLLGGSRLAAEVLAAPGLTVADLTAGGEAEAGRIRYRDLSSWERVQEVLRGMLRGYTEKDVGAFMRGISPAFEQDRDIFRNAVLGDFNEETDLRLDVQLLERRTTPATTSVRFRWNRTATRQGSGAPVVRDGEATFLFDRPSDLRVRQMRGQLPFGFTDAALQQQANVGQTAGSTEFFKTSFEVSEPPTTALIVDFESRSVRTFPEAGPYAGQVQPGDDLVGGNTLGATQLVFRDPQELITGASRPGVGFVDCAPEAGAADRIEDARAVVGNPISPMFPVETEEEGFVVVGARTDQGNYAVMAVKVDEISGGARYEVEWVLRRGGDRVLNPAGFLDCE